MITNPTIGHNQAPGMVEITIQTMHEISAWLAENPKIDEVTAQDAKVFLDRGKLAIKDAEDERIKKTGPINEQLREINAYYKGPRENLKVVLDELGRRLTNFIREEERQRIAAAQENDRRIAEAEQRAREAERLEQEAIESSHSGELGVDIAAHTVDADAKFKEYEKLQRAGAILQRESHVKISGGFSRAISLKQKETILVVNAIMALGELGLTEDIREAIVKSARAFRKLHNRLPQGIEIELRDEL